MQLANVRFGNDARLAMVGADDAFFALDGWMSLDEFLHDPQPPAKKYEILQKAAERRRRLLSDAVVLLPAVAHPGKIVCIGLNYRQHAQETGAAIPRIPVVFSKFSDAVAAHRQTVPIPRMTRQFDYEAELAIVMGEEADAISEGRALGAVFGYCNANDFSARDLQHTTSQWLLGKTGRAMAPLGPYVRTADTVMDPNHLRIRTWRGGELVQDSNMRDMIFSCAEIIAYASRHFVLEPDDVILTGTPSGVIMGQPEGERRWLQPGECMRVGIEGLGELENPLIAG